MKTKDILLLLPFCTFASTSFAAGPMTPGEIVAIFNRYESINKEFVSSADGTAEESQLRKRAEEYAEGPFDQALESAAMTICESENPEVLRALFSVILTTTNSASESPAWTLGDIYVCKPDLVAKEYRLLQPAQQQTIYDTLDFGFENVVYESQDIKRTTELRAQLHSLAPRMNK